MAKKIIQVNNNPVYENGMIATVFEKDTKFYGEVSFKKSLQINGYFEGEIKSEGFLVIGSDAEVKANVKAKNVIIKGTLYGNIEATEKLEIEPTGKLYGNIKTAKLKMADGVIFEGNCEMIAGSPTPKKEEVKKKTAESA